MHTREGLIKELAYIPQKTKIVYASRRPRYPISPKRSQWYKQEQLYVFVKQ